jgi:hypothetical protein
MNTSMFASAIGIDRPIKRKIRGCVIRNRAFGGFFGDKGAQNLRLFLYIPTIIKPLSFLNIKA